MRARLDVGGKPRGYPGGKLSRETQFRVGGPRLRGVSGLGDIRDLPPRQIWDGIAGRVLHGEQLTLGLVELEPGIHLPEHRHPNEQLGLVIEGAITFTVGGQTEDLGPGGTWRIPADTPHSAVVGPDGAIVIDVFAPPREDWKKLDELEPRPPRWPWT